MLERIIEKRWLIEILPRNATGRVLSPGKPKMFRSKEEAISYGRGIYEGHKRAGNDSVILMAEAYVFPGPKETDRAGMMVQPAKKIFG